MAAEKIYYAAVVFCAAVSVLLTPFFLVRRSSGRRQVRYAKKLWLLALAANLLVCGVLLLAWFVFG